MSFRKYGGINYAATNNIVRNHYFNSENANITDSIGELNSKIETKSHIDFSGNSILNVQTIYFYDGTSLSTGPDKGITGTKSLQDKININNSEITLINETMDSLQDKINNIEINNIETNELPEETGEVSYWGQSYTGLYSLRDSIYSVKETAYYYDNNFLSDNYIFYIYQNISKENNNDTGVFCNTSGNTILMSYIYVDNGGNGSQSSGGNGGEIQTGVIILENNDNINYNRLESYGSQITLSSNINNEVNSKFENQVTYNSVYGSLSNSISGQFVNIGSHNFYLGSSGGAGGKPSYNGVNGSGNGSERGKGKNALTGQLGNNFYYGNGGGGSGISNEEGGLGSSGALILYYNYSSFSTNLCGNVNISNDLTVTENIKTTNIRTTSDYRMIEKIEDIENSNLIDLLHPIKYNNKLSQKNDFGFLAHEVENYFPELISGSKDGIELQTINYNGLIPILVKEIQILRERVSALENK